MNYNSFETLKFEANELLQHLHLSSSLNASVVQTAVDTLTSQLADSIVDGTIASELPQIVDEFKRVIVDRSMGGFCESVVGTALSCRILSEDDSNTRLIDEYSPKLFKFLNGLEKIFNSTETEPADFKFSYLRNGLNRLLHSAAMLLNPSKSAGILTEREMNFGFSNAAKYAVARPLDRVWDPIGTMKHGENRSDYLEIGHYAHELTNSFYNFLADMAFNGECNRVIGIALRMDLMDFLDMVTKGPYGWEQKFDVQRLDLRVTREEMAYANDNGFFLYADYKGERLKV